MKEKKEFDKQDCFARISEYECNALIKKQCKNCNFYKHYQDVMKYEKYLPKKMKGKICNGREQNSGARTF